MFLHQGSSPPPEKGQSLVEYALVLVLVAIVIIFILTLFGTTIRASYCSILHQISPGADISEACIAPIVMPIVRPSSAGRLNVEANIFDPDGDPNNPYANIDRVEFHFDNTNGSPYRIERSYRYCLGGGNAPCGAENIGSLSPGRHNLYILVYDTDGVFLSILRW